VVELKEGQVLENINLKVTANAAPAMPAVVARDFNVSVLDEKSEPVAEQEIILTGPQQQANLSPLIGERATFAVRWKEAAIGGKKLNVDATGRLRLPGKELFSQPPFPLAVVAIDPDKMRGAIGSLAPDATTPEIELKMSALREVHLEIDSELLNDAAANSSTQLGIVAGESFLLSVPLETSEITFLLPSGEYTLFCYNVLAELKKIDFKVPESTDGNQSKVIELQAQLKPSRLTELIGLEAPPLKEIVAWQGGDPIALNELRGKVVLLDFWGFWCGPCLESMPKLMQLHDEFGDKGLVIIAVHDGTMTDLKQLNEQLKKAKSTIWKGRDLPFRVALAGGGPVQLNEFSMANGQAIADYGIVEFPTTLLIDREGKIVSRLDPNSHEKNLETIQKLLNEK
jgi:thiol-disulfide isomerase/thioredoxin